MSLVNKYLLYFGRKKNIQLAKNNAIITLTSYFDHYNKQKSDFFYLFHFPFMNPLKQEITYFSFLISSVNHSVKNHILSIFWIDGWMNGTDGMDGQDNGVDTQIKLMDRWMEWVDGIDGMNRRNEWIVEQFRSLGVRYVKVQEYCTVSVS